MAKKDATASVTMAKKIALTRSENNPTKKDSASDNIAAAAVPIPMESQSGPKRPIAIAIP